MTLKTDLSSFNNDWYKPGAGILKRVTWYFVNAVFFKSSFPIVFVKVFLLKIFGAKVGQGLIIKPGVNIKYPWKLNIGNHVWIGENVWIDNLEQVTIENNVCISQGAFLLCGNHDYKKAAFDLMLGEIKLEDGVWLGAKSIVSGGVICHSHSILTVGAVTSKDLDAFSVYQGNPAQKIKERSINR